jgi:hypothetical protein
MNKERFIRHACLAAIVAASFSTAAFAQTRYFSFITPNSPSSSGGPATTLTPHEFVFAVNDPVIADQLLSILSNNSLGRTLFPIGKVVRGRVAYNEEYPFHLDPSTIQLVSNATEQCDATAFVVEENLERVGVPNAGFLNDGYWCPYSARFVRELKFGPIQQ